MFNQSKLVYISCALIMILGLAVYANSLGGEFLWDDHHLIEDNMTINRWSKVTRVFTTDIASGAGGKYNFYRPLQIISYMFDYWLWKLNPIGYHLTNILLHILTALCLYWLINLIFKQPMLAFLSSVLFVVHPVHTEAVAYISGRADSLALLFMALCFIFYAKLQSKENIGLCLW